VAIFEEEEFRPRHTDNSDEVSYEELQASEKFHCTSTPTDAKKACLYNESYLSMGFTWTGVQDVLFYCASSVANDLQ
jgi:hypothetical protein